MQQYGGRGQGRLAQRTDQEESLPPPDADSTPVDDLFETFSAYLQKRQSEIISEVEAMERESGCSEAFSRDTWGAFSPEDDSSASSGGITRVLQRGNIVEKGACSFTLLRDGTLSAERAAAIQGRQPPDGAAVREGDHYAAAALSIVLHSRSPLVPTFRSDVRIFLVRPQDGGASFAWFGGGADLTPYYLFDDDVSSFHAVYRDLCRRHAAAHRHVDYPAMKRSCDSYFYLPARAEHRGTGGIFFDDLPASPATLSFVQGVTDAWTPSWFPIVRRHLGKAWTERQREWQLVRRGRYLEFNLLYDRGVRFGLAGKNPRVEGVMVSAPPLIRWEYCWELEPGSEEERLVKVLKQPKDWV